MQQLINFTAVLGNKSAAPADRLEALKWVVHFVGDIHQPLHAEDNKDRGGNDVAVTFFHISSKENLHHVWDSNVLEKGLNLPTKTNGPGEIEEIRSAAAKLNDAIAPEQAKAWAPAGLVQNDEAIVVTWANESHKLAHDVAYADLPVPPSKAERETLGADYEAAAWPVVKGQLERGGVRLAELLNEALK